MKFRISGQFLFFPMISAISGNVVAGIISGSNAISGWRSTDGGLPIALSGPVVEVQNNTGLYVAQLYDWDTSGNYLGYMFTASGCVPQSFSVETDNTTSGRLFPASGVNSLVPPASISGVVANSGLFVSVPIVTLSGVVANSGLFVSVLPANLSGVVVNSGLFVTVPIATISGVVANSGLFTVVPPASLSGTTVIVLPATLSGVVANSGLTVTVLPASISGVVANSGLFVTVPPVTLSGAILLPSGSLVALLSGNIGVDIPQGILKANYSGITGEADRSLLNATRKLVNKWDTTSSSGKLSVFKEDDSSLAYTQNITATSGASPISALDTNN